MAFQSYFQILIFLTFVTCSIAFKTHHPDFYGKPCTNNSTPDPHQVHCDLDKNMYCSEKAICECILGERGRIFSHHDRTCIEVASPENNFACTDDIQCKLSQYGRYSRCNRDYDRCECFDESQKTVLVNDVCYIHHAPRALKSSIRVFQGCQTDGDCKGSSLGELSRCNEAESSCECYDTRTSGKKDVDVYNGRCVYKKALMEFCKDDDECKAGYHKNAFCGAHDTFLPKETVCQCPHNVNCDSGAFRFQRVESQSLVMIAFTTAMLGIVATKVLG